MCVATSFNVYTPSMEIQNFTQIIRGDRLKVVLNYWDDAVKIPTWFVMQRQLFSSGSSAVESAPTGD